MLVGDVRGNDLLDRLREIPDDARFVLDRGEGAGRPRTEHGDDSVRYAGTAHRLGHLPGDVDDVAEPLRRQGKRFREYHGHPRIIYSFYSI